MALAAEALLAVTGLWPEPPIARAQGIAAMALPREWGAKVRDFFDLEKPRKWRFYARSDHERTLIRLTKGISEDEHAQLIARLENAELGQDYMLTLSNAREYLRQRWPSLKLDTPTEPWLLEPGLTTMGDAWAIHAVLDDPGRVIDEMCMGTLATVQVEVFRAVYPGLAEMLRAQLDAEVKRRWAAKKSYQVPWGQQRMMRRYLQMSPDMSLSQVQQPPAKTAAASPKLDIDFKGQATKAQQLET